MKTTHNINAIPPNTPYIRIDGGNEFLYIYKIENKNFIDVTLFEGKSIAHKCRTNIER